MIVSLEKLRMYGVKTSFSYALSEFKSRTTTRHLRGSYNQQGEDLVIDELLGHRSNCFYVDIGAGDPLRFNNTKRFCKRGWTGINIEPSPRLYLRLENDQ